MSGDTFLERAGAYEPEQQRLRRPHRFWPNLVLTLVVMGVTIGGWVDPVVMFMLGTVAALILNYPKFAEQRARIDAHAKAALLMAAILLAAGAFTGIMAGPGMLKALAQAAITVVPPAQGTLFPRSSAWFRCRSASCSIRTATISA